jgi:hypothetical protein
VVMQKIEKIQVMKMRRKNLFEKNLDLTGDLKQFALQALLVVMQKIEKIQVMKMNSKHYNLQFI